MITSRLQSASTPSNQLQIVDMSPSNTEREFETISMKIVTRLLEQLPKNQYYKLVFDNWFTTEALTTWLCRNGYGYIATIRSSRFDIELLSNDKTFKKQNRGDIESYSNVDGEKVVIYFLPFFSYIFISFIFNFQKIIRWLDNKPIYLSSNIVGVNPISSVKRNIKNSVGNQKVKCPAIVKEYNRYMGGVDLVNMFHALYR